MKSSVRFAIALVAILVVGLLVNSWAYLGEAHVDRKPLKDFPTQIDTWSRLGADTQLDEPTMKVLRASDYLLRDYRRTDGLQANLYVGYYASQKDGATFHSPLNCLPGSGWTLTEPAKRMISTPQGFSFQANQYVIQNGSQRVAMIYWYQGRGRTVASEYWGKIYTVIDSVRLRRSDAAMIRVTVPIVGVDAASLDAAAELAGKASEQLAEFVPN
ncbi:MAG TPA: EpsI family protein [Pyrinomonadaceae bacterium]|nr:EpsI family protein [Pyrinomonadaceae bacterium]